MISTFGGARLPKQGVSTNQFGFPEVIRDGNDVYTFTYILPKCKSIGMAVKARYTQKRYFGTPQKLILSMREAYLLA